MSLRIGPVFDAGFGLKLQDLDAACGQCSKRLSEVIHDPSGRWNSGTIICIDEGTEARLPREHRTDLKPSYRAPGRWIAVCTCHWWGLPSSKTEAERKAQAHLEQVNAA